MGYYPYVRSCLADSYDVIHNEGNAGDSDNVVRKLDEWLSRDKDVALVHFNCGLHDIKIQRDRSDHQVPLGRYRENLIAVLAKLARFAEGGKKLIWASSTPVVFERHRARKDFDRRIEDVDNYNAVALEVMGAEGVGIDDLYAAVESAGRAECLSADGVHMTDQCYEMLGNTVAQSIRLSMEEQC